MSRAIDTALVSPKQWLLEIPEAIHQNILREGQSLSLTTAAWNHYLAQVTLAAINDWFQAEGETTTAAIASDTLSQLNQWFGGSAIDWAGKRLILLPQATLDQSELLVPQEWIDIAQWQGDYFLAAQVDWDDRCISIWGYTTHAQIKQFAEYVADERLYRLDAIHLIQDLNTFWVTRQLCPDEVTQVAIAPIPLLTTSDVNSWFEQLGTMTNPRLSIPFETWAALITQPDWLAQLCRHQSMASSQSVDSPAASEAPTLGAIATNLGQWFNDVIDETWQTLESWMEPSLTPAYAFRDDQSIDRSMIRRVKALRFAEDVLLLLVLTVTPTEDGRLLVQVQLYPDQREQCLPQQVSLSLCTSDRAPIQTVSSREQDNLIQLRQFRCPPGFEFVVQVTQDDMIVDVPFVA